MVIGHLCMRIFTSDFRCLVAVVSVLITFFIEHVQLTLNYSPVNPMTKLACTAKSLWSPLCLQLAHNRSLAKATAFKWWPGIKKKKVVPIFGQQLVLKQSAIVKVTWLKTFLLASGAWKRNRRSQMIKQLPAIRRAHINIQVRRVTHVASPLNLLTSSS